MMFRFCETLPDLKYIDTLVYGNSMDLLRILCTNHIKNISERFRKKNHKTNIGIEHSVCMHYLPNWKKRMG